MTDRLRYHNPEAPVDYRVRQLRQVFPEAFADGDMELATLLSLIGEPGGQGEEAAPGFRWPGREAALRSLRHPPASSLRSLAGLVGPASHVFVVGDNYESMKLLQRAYAGTIKMAFLDPPYNNGTDDIYVDNFDDPQGRYLAHTVALEEGQHSPAMVSSAGRGAHSRWLTMMLPRLFVTRNLLSDGGVVFITIDDHESHRLRLLMDELFGPENFVCTFIWEKRYSPAPDARDVGYVHENILCYRKSDSFDAALLPMTTEQTGRYRNPDNDPRGPWKAADYTCRFTATERPNLFYPVIHPKTGEEIWPKRSRVWACTREVHNQNVADGRLWWGPGQESQVPARKAYLSEIRQGRMPSTLLTHEEVGHTDDATKELRRFFPDLKYTPKPVRLLRHLIEIADLDDGDVVLDPFGRVGTTAEAVVTHNNESGKDLRFLLITLPERVEGAEPAKDLHEVGRQRAEACLASAVSGPAWMRVVQQSDPIVLPPLVPDSDWSGVDSEEDAATLYMDEACSDEDLALNLALARGQPLDATVQLVMPSEGLSAYVFGGEFAVCLQAEGMTESSVTAMSSLNVRAIVCLESHFAGQEELLLNARLTMKDRQIAFETL